MTGKQELALLLAGVYLLECSVRVPRGALVLRPRGGAPRLRRPAEWTDVLQGSLVLDRPLPPLDGAILLQPWPLSLAPEGFVAAAPAGDASPPRFVPWEEVGEVSADGSVVRIRDAGIGTFASPEAAGHVARLLVDAAAETPGRRARFLASALDARLDADAVAARRAAWREATARLRVSTHGLFLATLGTVLGLLGVPLLHRAWPWCLGAAAIALPWTLLGFSRAHRKLHPGADAARRRSLLTLSLSPLGAIRAESVVARELYAAWDPLAVAAVACDEDGFREFARGELCRLHHPEPPPADRPDAVRRCEASSRALQVERVERFLKRRALDPAALLAPPPRTSPENRSYCPRCRMQYVIPPGACADCRGVPLVALAGAESPAGAG